MPMTRREFLRRARMLGAIASVPSIAVGCSTDTDSDLPIERGDVLDDELADARGTDAGRDARTDDGTDSRDGEVDGADTAAADVDANEEDAGEASVEPMFRHGVASGDPLQDSVILWTRADGEIEEAATLEVTVVVAETPTFDRVIARETFETSADRDWTIKIEVAGLSSGTTYYYRFTAGDRQSPIGRTKTLPAGDVDRVRLAACSCSNYAYGYFHAYRHLARRRDLDAVLHLGDYIYEYASAGHGETFGIFRELDPLNEIVTLDDYRKRYAHYRSDPDLWEVHRQNPFIHVWDDHEFACDPYVGGATNHQPAEDGDWRARVANALQAYDEWMPTRLRDGGRIYRTFAFGELANLVVLDRQHRFIWPGDADAGEYLGAEQAAWLDERIAETTQRWLLLGVGTTFAPHNEDMVSGSSWDPSSRDRVLDAVREAEIENLAVVTGDIHRFEALDIVDDPDAYEPGMGEGSAGVELSAGSISSPGSNRDIDGVPQFRWNAGFHRGYVVLDLTTDGLRADFFGFVDFFKAYEELPDEESLASFHAEDGARALRVAPGPAEPRSDAPELAPTG